MIEKEFTFKTKGVCSSLIQIKTYGNVIKDVIFTGGCNGNAQGISLLVKGMKVQDVIQRLKGVGCDGRNTSCPDQLSMALQLMEP